MLYQPKETGVSACITRPTTTGKHYRQRYPAMLTEFCIGEESKLIDHNYVF
jgi:hypothetical protein